MTTYADVLHSLRIDSSVAECAAGRPPLPLTSFTSPAEWYGFPPALVPIASDGSDPAYLGLWVHPFSSRRASYVSMSVENGHTLTEIARTDEQFATYIAIRALVEADGRTSAIETFAGALGLDVDEVDRLSLTVGDDVSRFHQLPVFRAQCPLAACAALADYDGDFPLPTIATSVAGLTATGSPFEIGPEARRRIAESPEAPAWWTRSDKPPLFDAAMAAGDHRAAWLALNSPGWNANDAGHALGRLAGASDEAVLRLLHEAWCALAGADAALAY